MDAWEAGCGLCSQLFFLFPRLRVIETGYAASVIIWTYENRNIVRIGSFNTLGCDEYGQAHIFWALLGLCTYLLIFCQQG
jgi:hypothetical protein